MQLSPEMLFLLVLGIIILVVGVVLKYSMKKNIGLLLLVVGIGWLITFGFYFALNAAGIYGLQGEQAGFANNIIGGLLFILGIIGIYYIVKKKGAEGGA
ncbi:MAG: hypothetical protein ACP6IS_12285 [Candidatus Asgardarchaeia archaeon]